MPKVTLSEQETVVINNMGEEWVYIDSCVQRDITKLERHPRVEIVDKGYFGRTKWVKARVPMGDWNPVSGVKRVSTRVFTEEERVAAAARLAKAREAR